MEVAAEESATTAMNQVICQESVPKKRNHLAEAEVEVEIEKVLDLIETEIMIEKSQRTNLISLLHGELVIPTNKKNQLGVIHHQVL